MLKDFLQPFENIQSEAFREKCLRAYFEYPTPALQRRQEESYKALTFASEDELRDCLSDPRVLTIVCGKDVFLTTIHPDALGDHTPTHMIATRQNGSGGASTPFLEGCEQFPNHWEVLRSMDVWGQGRYNQDMLTAPFMTHPPSKSEAMSLLKKWGKPPLTAITKEQSIQFSNLSNPGQIVYLIDHISLDGSSNINADQFVRSIRQTVPGGKCLVVFNAPQTEGNVEGNLTHALQLTGFPIDIVTQQDYGKIEYSGLQVDKSPTLALSIGSMHRTCTKDMINNSALIQTLINVEQTAFGIDSSYHFSPGQRHESLPYPSRTLFDQCFSPEQVKLVLTAPDHLVEKFIYFSSNGDPIGYFVQMTREGIQSALAREITSHNPIARQYKEGEQDLRVTVNWVKSKNTSFAPSDLIKMLNFIAPDSRFTMYQDTGRLLGNSGLPLMYCIAASEVTRFQEMQTHNLAVLGVL